MHVVYGSVQEVYRVTGLKQGDVSETDVEKFLEEASAEVEEIFNKKFTPDNPQTEQIDGDGKKTIIPTKNPIQTVNSIEFLRQNNLAEVQKTLNPNEWVKYETKIELLNNVTPVGKKNVKLDYTFGFAEVPKTIQELCNVLAGIRALTQVTGGKYEDWQQHAIGKESETIGTYLKDAYDALVKKAEELVKEKKGKFLVASSNHNNERS